MGTIWIKEFSGGLDARRLPVNTPGGNLITGYDGHINRGGDFEQRADFVAEYTLPAGTHGLAATQDTLVVFGSIADPTLPIGVSYQRLQHPDGTTAMRAILSVDQFKSNFYVIAEFEDGKFFHFYNGTLVEDWADGRARASFDVVSGDEDAGSQAFGTFTITSTQFGVREIYSVSVNSVVITTATINVGGGSPSDAAGLVVANINANTGVSGYTATNAGGTVTIRAVARSTTANGYDITVDRNVGVSVDNFVAFSGGEDPTISTLENLTIDGVAAIASPVEWPGTAAGMAQAIVDAVNSHTSTPDYLATLSGARVDIRAVDYGTSEDGKAVVFTVSDDLVLDPPTGLELGGGGESEAVYVPGRFARTVKEKMYALSGSVLHFSKLADPGSWLPEDTGAGFVDVAGINSGFEQLMALARYQQYLAVFAEDATIIYYIDPDPTLNKEVQVLNNTGTISPRSVTQFGDSDLFYLHESGLRSLRARDSTLSATTVDIGSAVDDIIQPIISAMSTDERLQIIGLIEPREGRFWLIIGQQIFVFTFYPGSKISAWSIYRLGFSVDHAIKFRRRAYLRSGNTVYVYGGLAATPQYSAVAAVAQLPYLDAGKPNVKKILQSLDVACVGTWKVEVGMNTNDRDTLDTIGRVSETTYNQSVIPARGEGTHFSFKFTLEATPTSGPAKLSSVAIQFEAEDDGDG